MTDFEKQVLEDLAELKTNMRWIAGGDNRPGKLQELTEQVQRHEAFLQKARGLSAAMACLFTVVHLGIDYLRLHFSR
jgi:UDP-N-acetylmuramoylalanine-D-glutamate ligase